MIRNKKLRLILIVMFAYLLFIGLQAMLKIILINYFLFLFIVFFIVPVIILSMILAAILGKRKTYIMISIGFLLLNLLIGVCYCQNHPIIDGVYYVTSKNINESKKIRAFLWEYEPTPRSLIINDTLMVVKEAFSELKHHITSDNDMTPIIDKYAASDVVIWFEKNTKHKYIWPETWKIENYETTWEYAYRDYGKSMPKDIIVLRFVRIDKNLKKKNRRHNNELIDSIILRRKYVFNK